MKLKLPLLDKVMSGDEAFLCFLRGAAGRSVRLTFWPPRLLVKVPCQYLFFSCIEISLSHTGFTILPRSLGSSKVLFDWLYKWGMLEPGVPSLLWLSLIKWQVTSPGHSRALAAIWGFILFFASWNAPHCVITLCLMLGSIEQISDGYLLTFTMLKITDLHQPPPISVDIRIFSLDYTVLHNDGALEEALEIPP